MRGRVAREARESLAKAAGKGREAKISFTCPHATACCSPMFARSNWQTSPQDPGRPVTPRGKALGPSIKCLIALGLSSKEPNRSPRGEQLLSSLENVSGIPHGVHCLFESTAQALFGSSVRLVPPWRITTIRIVLGNALVVCCIPLVLYSVLFGTVA